MKILKLASMALVISLISCGTKQQVITNSGKIYQVQGDKFYHQGKEVTEVITAEEKDHIISTLNERLGSESEALAQQQAIDKARKEAEELQKKAEKAQKAAQKEAKAIQDKLENEADVRKYYVKAKNNLKQAQSKYDKLHSKGELSPRDEAKWAKKIKNLLEKLQKSEKALNKL